MIVFHPENPLTPNPLWAYHIVHCDRLASILKDGFLWADSEFKKRGCQSGTTIGFSHIKERRLVTPVVLGADLMVGDCVPFYYCPRSVMLYVIHCADSPELMYRGGQRDIIHLMFDPVGLANWAKESALRYYVTDVTAACAYFTAYDDIKAIDLLDWNSISARSWRDVTDRKQAEFLVENRVPISLLGGIGVIDSDHVRYVTQTLKIQGVTKEIEVRAMPQWYY